MYLEAKFDSTEDDRLVEEINRLALATPDVVVIACDCHGSKLISRVRDRIKAVTAPTPDADMVDCFDDKWRFYEFCKAHGLNVPNTRFFQNKRDLHFAPSADALGIPFMVKPLSQYGSKGVQFIESDEDYRRQILENEDYQYSPLIAQSYIRGVDIGINLLAVKGKLRALALQRRQQPQNPAAKITFFPDARLRKVVETLLVASGYEGVMNIDARIEDGTGDVYLFESNPRFWTSLLASVLCGLNFVAESINVLGAPGDMCILASGTADIFYHPLFRPALWRYVLFDAGPRGRMLRLMMFDICTFVRSIKDIFTRNGLAAPPGPKKRRRLRP
jgi:predicted ATP-grasp superfamily ATP-dependent carboligase